MKLLKIAAIAMPVLAMTASPVVAAQPAAQKLSIAQVAGKRAIVKPRAKSQASGSGLIILILAGAAVVGGIIAATSGDSSPDSP
jgi:hypothetical protein